MKSRKIFWGVFFILAAVFAIVSKLGVLPDIGVFRILLTVFLAWVMVEGIRGRNFFGILFPVAFFCIIYDQQLHLTALTPGPVLVAALFASIGLSIIFKDWKRIWKSSETWEENGHRSVSGSSSQQCSGEQTRCENNFGTAIRYINSDNFRNAQIENNFGTMSVYFDNAVIQEGSACINVENNFGTVNLYIPKEWKVQNNLQHSLGAIHERGSSIGTSESRVFINGSSNFGEINVIYI